MQPILFDGAGRRKYLTDAEARQFLRSAALLPSRARLLCSVLAFTGCRLSEALALSCDHIDDGMVTIRTLKRRRLVFRRVPVPQWLCAALIAEAGEWRARNGSAEEGGLIFDVHRTTAYRWVKRAMRLSAISGAQACPKGLRHGFGIRAVLARAPASLVQRWLGHASPGTTAIYLDALGEEERHFAHAGWQRLAS